jgi:hypothetical protein
MLNGALQHTVILPGSLFRRAPIEKCFGIPFFEKKQSQNPEGSWD